MTLNELEKIKTCLNNSGVIAFPTETVMGLGVVFDDFVAYKKLNDVKNRPEDKPYTLMLGNINDIGKYANLSQRDRILINAFMPGPLTILLNARTNVPGYVTHNTNIIGIRVPNQPEICEMINFVNKPLLVPSANKSGERPCLTAEEVKKVFNNEIDYIVNADSLGEKPSTIIDLTGTDIKMIREGQLTLETIKRRLENMKIAIGSDHAGFDTKLEVINYLKSLGHDVIDVGTHSKESCNYPDFGGAAAKLVASHEADYGVVICSSGEGICIAANKVHGVRCGLGYNDQVAALLRQHNDANMIAFGASFMSLEDIKRRISIFLTTNFEDGRHQKRVDLISDLEK